MKQYLPLILFLFLYQSTVFCQAFNYKTQFDINNDGAIEEILFYDLNEEEFENTQFTKISIVKGMDTISFINDDVWVVKPDFYEKADNQIADRFGVFYADNRVFLWLTGFQYGCCLNATSILEWTGDSLKETFNKEYEINDVTLIKNKRYLIGRQWLSEVYGGFGIKEAPYYYMSFAPKEFRILSEGMQVDSILTQKENLVAPILEEKIDVYHATIVHVNYFNEDILISRDFESALSDKSYGILSLVKVNEDYLKDYTRTELRIARNELFAFKGYKFNSSDLSEYFSKKDWYNPVTTNSDSIYQSLSEIEKYNINLVREMEITVGNKLE